GWGLCSHKNRGIPGRASCHDGGSAPLDRASQGCDGSDLQAERKYNRKHCRTHPDPDTYSKSKSNANSNPNPNPNAYPHSNSNAYPYSNSNAYPYSNSRSNLYCRA